MRRARACMHTHTYALCTAGYGISAWRGSDSRRFLCCSKAWHCRVVPVRICVRVCVHASVCARACTMPSYSHTRAHTHTQYTQHTFTQSISTLVPAHVRVRAHTCRAQTHATHTHSRA